MEKLTIKLGDGAKTECCGLCNEPLSMSQGFHLSLPQTEVPVCRNCGKRHAPEMVALLDLAQVAERVGRTCRHILVPPLEALLDLARAAEDYTETRPKVSQKVA